MLQLSSYADIAMSASVRPPHQSLSSFSSDLPDLVSSQVDAAAAAASARDKRGGPYDTPPPRRVTKVSLDSAGGAMEPSPVISPWNTHQHGRPGSTSSNESSSGELYIEILQWNDSSSRCAEQIIIKRLV